MRTTFGEPKTSAQYVNDGSMEERLKGTAARLHVTDALRRALATSEPQELKAHLTLALAHAQGRAANLIALALKRVEAAASLLAEFDRLSSQYNAQMDAADREGRPAESIRLSAEKWTALDAKTEAMNRAKVQAHQLAKAALDAVAPPAR